MALSIQIGKYEQSPNILPWMRYFDLSLLFKYIKSWIGALFDKKVCNRELIMKEFFPKALQINSKKQKSHDPSRFSKVQWLQAIKLQNEGVK